MRSAFQEELDGVTQTLVDLSQLVSEAISSATHALVTSDLKEAEAVIAADDRVDDIQHELDARIIDIIARQQPVASDLRALVTALRMSADLERMGDMAHHVAKIARLRHPASAVPQELLATIEEMGKVARLISDKVGGIINSRDIDKALEVERDDDEMDKLHRKLFTTLLDP
ncbi:MAG: phosphate signaling complex protein PhoU, partial [Candidatus Nanopelagicaceae bacterium]|nr:phosphate signaling complex protein PhoU [Candidatus Nanopelagicaceae bacterium]